MRHKILSIMAISAIILFLRGNCFAQISGIITNDTTWADSVRLNGDVVIDTGATLSIQPGTRINVTTSGAWDTTLGISGKRDLIILGNAQIKGTETDSIIFNGLGTIRIKNNACDTIKYVKISNAIKGIWIDSSVCTIHNSTVGLSEIGIYIDNGKVVVDSCKVSTKLHDWVNLVAGIYCQNSNIRVNNSTIDSVSSRYGTSGSSGAPAYGFYAIGGDSLSCKNTVISNIAGGNFDLSYLSGYAGGSVIGLYRKKGIYTSIDNLDISKCIGGHGSSCDEYVPLPTGGHGGNATGVLLDSTSTMMTDITIDYCQGGDGGDVEDVVHSSESGAGGNGGNAYGIWCINTSGTLDTYTITNLTGGYGGNADYPGLDGVAGNILLDNNSNLVINGIEGQTEGKSAYPLQSIKCFPNPSCNSINIKYVLRIEQPVNLSIYNIAGQCVKTLINDHQQAGAYEVVWKGNNNGNTKATPGVYFCRMHTPKKCFTVKIILLK